MPAPTYVQSGYNQNSGVDVTVTLGGAPTDGNMVIAVVYLDAGGGPSAVNGWTKHGSSSANGRVTVFWRIASGLTATPPATTSGNSGYMQVAMFEVSGTPATFSSAVDQYQLYDNSTGSTSLAEGPLTTGVANTLAVIVGFEWFAVFPNTPSLNGGDGWTQDFASSGGFAQVGVGGHQTISGASANFQGTCNWNGTTATHEGGVLFNLKGSGGSETGTATMTFAGISFNATGQVPDAFGTGLMAFSGISFTAAGQVSHIVGSANLAFSGISINAHGYLPSAAGAGRRQFWTFGA